MAAPPPSLLRKLHSFTATVIHDFERMELRQPRYREAARLALVAAVFLAMLTATTVLTIRQPSIRTDLRTGMVPVAAELAARSGNSNSRISNASQNLPFVCPCSQPETSWCSYTTFYLLFPRQIMNVHGIVVIQQLPIDVDTNYANVTRELCGDEPSSDACHTLVGYTMRATDSHTSIFTANLLSLETLYDIVASEIEDMLMGAILPTSGPNGTKVDNRTLTVAALMSNMASQFQTNTSSSISDFWNTSQNVLADARASYTDVKDLPKDLGLSMSVNWTRYMEACKPSFCIIISHITTSYRLLQAIAQAGGMYTAIILVARMVIWPAIVWIYPNFI